ncbi:MAG: T9SS type A sorting domain-containing protein [Flavobacteriales bacterium]|nr:T9SS type A sorting domain-containing protein [Flavobacteriales bacterium]
MRHIPLSAVLFLSIGLTAQDTIQVQTLTFSDITQRRGWWVFPDSTHTYRKVLMHHTLKCDPATTADSYACGEWDYLTYNFIHHHTGVNDSVAMLHPVFKVGAAAPPSIEMVSALMMDQQQRDQDQRLITATNSESDHFVGMADAQDDLTLGMDQGVARSQFIFTAAELMAAGLAPGEIQQLRFHAVDGGPPVHRLTIRIKHTASNSLSAFDPNGLVTVFDHGAQFTPGVNTVMLTNPFSWNGTSNLLVEICGEMLYTGPGALLQASAVMDMGVRETGRDGYLAIGNDIIGADPAPFAGLNDKITITFRTRGDTLLPVNTSILEAVNAQNQRVLNVHLPWSNGRIYWDAGRDAAGYDRIDQAVTPADYEGQWTSWAFVKNTTTGSMKIYKNGLLFHSGTGKTKSMAGIVKFVLGSAFNGSNPYPGLIDEVNVFSTELTSSIINSWKDRRVDATHPNSADLIASYHFDELPADFQLANAVDANAPAWPLGTVQRRYKRALELAGPGQPANERPDITFVQGDYTTTVQSTTVLDPVPQPYLSKETFHVVGNYALPLDTTFGWSAGNAYTFDPNGAPVDSTAFSGVVSLNGDLSYYAPPFEVVNDYEIGRYITPYGIGLSLGPNGFTWTFDVTEYQHLLRDSVDLSAGNNQELIDLRFELIEGTPPRGLVRHQRPWGRQRSYSYAALSDNTALAPVTVDLHPLAAQWALRSRLTGHGHNSNDGSYPHCCEWKDNEHYISVNGVQADAWHIWQTHDCAQNPVYPQGGTWLGAREGWCPGDLVKDHVTDLTPYISGSSTTIDYAITPVPANNTGMGGGNYVVNMDLFEFSAAAHTLDAEVYHVKRPTNEAYLNRENPICTEPIVVLRNAGSQVLTSVTFTYGVSGGPQESHTWNGSLKHMEMAEVVLPVANGWFWMGDGANTFTVTVSAPNGGADQYAANNSYTTRYAPPVVYANGLILNYKTNNRPFQNSAVIRDMYGTAVYQKNWSTLAAQTTYSDTVPLTPGCYTFELLDTGNDGLSYWADAGQGSGFFRLRNSTGSILKTFQAEFGRKHHWAFTIGDIVGVEEVMEHAGLSVWPNPGQGLYTLQTEGFAGRIHVLVMDVQGRVVQQRELELPGSGRFTLDLNGLGDGIYLVRLTDDASQAMVRVVKE